MRSSRSTDPTGTPLLATRHRHTVLDYCALFGSSLYREVKDGQVFICDGSWRRFALV